MDGRHYARTCKDWLANFDANRERVLGIFQKQHGPVEARFAMQRWRMFLMACAELFGYQAGSQWIVGHYLFEPARSAVHLEREFAGGPRA